MEDDESRIYDEEKGWDGNIPCTFFHKNKDDRTWWVSYDPEEEGRLPVTFDKKRILNLWQDYPQNFTAEEKEIFDRENPYWANFFKGRSK